MGASKDRSANRQERRSRKKVNHEPILRLAQEQITRRPTKARTIVLSPLTEAQRLYDASIAANVITFGIGPAGTGKTWWAAMRAAEKLKAGEIERLIITRPAMEAGEKLGFLPGELDEKYEPYFRPVRDALEESFGSGHLEYLIKSGVVEARPLAYLRGSTLKHAWVIADEMQNATVTQFKLLLTRIGDDAKFIINGDPSQCDFPRRSDSGLIDATRRLVRVKNVGVCTFGIEDIVRSGICQAVVEAYQDTTEEPSEHRYNANDEGVMRTIKAA